MPTSPVESFSRERKILYGVTNWALFVSGLANLVAGTLAAFSSSPTIAATSLTAGLVLLFAATIDRFESFKGLGIEAKTRQLDQKINQADDALKRLREMTELTGSALIDLNCKMGRWDSVPEPREFVALADRIRELMLSVGSSEETISNALAPWAKTLCFDMARAKTTSLQKLIKNKVQELERELQAIRQPMQADDPNFARISGQLRTLQEFQSSHFRNLHKITLDDFADKFMVMFSDVPMIDDQQLAPLREEAAQFANGMRALAKNRTLPDRELWIDSLNSARDK